MCSIMLDKREGTWKSTRAQTVQGVARTEEMMQLSDDVTVDDVD